MSHRELPLPPHFDEEQVGKVWRVPYEERAHDALRWAQQYDLPPAAEDDFRVVLVLVDVQNTFCLPDFELFVGGRSGTGAVDDNRRLCAFIYRNLPSITRIDATMDTHQAMQIFHAIFWVNEQGEHPSPYTLITEEDVREGRWRFNATIAESLNLDPDYVQPYVLHYTQSLKAGGKYTLTIWPYHAMLGGIGHALVPAVEEALFFHAIARQSQPRFLTKGNHPLTENYSILGPEVYEDQHGQRIAQRRNEALVEEWLGFDAILIAGQAKSHCVAWTVEDLLRAIQERDAELARKVYLLEDCTSPVVVPGVVDYTDEADTAFQRFAQAGMNLVRSTEPVTSWPGWPS